MKVTLSEHAGFCPGVRAADKRVNKLIGEKKPNRIYTLGHLIHNRIYNDALESMGVKSIAVSEVEKEYNTAPDIPMTVVIRTHGITREDDDYLASLAREHVNLTVVDATCPYVKKIHKIADENTGEDTFFLLFSDPSHPEAIGIMSYAHGEKLAFSSTLQPFVLV